MVSQAPDARWMEACDATMLKGICLGNVCLLEAYVLTRDSEGMQSRQSKPRKPRVSKRSREEATVRIPGDLSQCPRWAALRRRILDTAGIG